MSDFRKLTLSAVLAALTCVATIVVQIPVPLTNGYINMGDCIVLLAGWILGARYGFAAAGIGSALADLLTGYAHYAPATLIIKGLMAVAAALLLRLIQNHSIALIISSLAAEAVMILGYFLYSWLLLGDGIAAAVASILPNAVQGVAGMICGVLLDKLLEKTGIVTRLLKNGQ